MTNKILALAIIAQLCATTAFAQSSGGSDSGSGTDSGAQGGITDPNDETSAGDGEALGTGWSESLGTAMFTDTTRQTVRTPDELTTQWGTLSTEDREMLRRDCAAYSTDASGGTSGAASGGTSDTTAGTTTGMSADAGTMTGVTRTQMDEICATVGSLQ